MKVLITGTKGLALALTHVYSTQSVTMVSKSTGHNIHCIELWGQNFLDYDCVFNCAYDGFGQIKVLEYFFYHWAQDCNKIIVSIGSKVTSQPRTGPETGYWDYRLHKQALQLAHQKMVETALCDMKLINPGPIDTAMSSSLNCSKFSPAQLAQHIGKIVQVPEIKQVDLWP